MAALPHNPTQELKSVLAEHLPWHGARLSFLAHFLLALIKVRSVNLAELAIGGCDALKDPRLVVTAPLWQAGAAARGDGLRQAPGLSLRDLRAGRLRWKLGTARPHFIPPRGERDRDQPVDGAHSSAL